MSGAHRDRPGRDEAGHLTSPILAANGFAHAFFTRTGGASAAPWDSLSFALNTGDRPQDVAENLRRAAIVLGCAPERIYYPSQVHGADVIEVDGSEARDDVVRREADATLAVAPRVACAVRSADCGTVLVGDRRGRGVVAVHAGWRGVVRGVVGAAVRALLARSASQAVDLVAAVGPHIEACCFEVGDDVARELSRASSLGDDAVLLTAEKPRVDLRSILTRQLNELGISSVDQVAGCTVCDRERFFSFRRDGAVSGRLMSAIVAG